VECSLGGRTLSLETGKLAKQATGAVFAQHGDTVALIAVVEGPPIAGRDFFPLQVEYREKAYAAGKFPGGFIKREGRPSTKETLTSRLIDRPIRPLFPADYLNEVQIMAMVLSADRDNDPDTLCMLGASAALHITHVPFLKPTGAVRVGRVHGELVVMPTHEQLEESDLDLIVAGTRDAVTMIEGFAREIPDTEMADAIVFGHRHILTVIDLIDELRRKMGLADKPAPAPKPPHPLVEVLAERYAEELKTRKLLPGKQERNEAVKEAVKELRDKIIGECLPEDREPAYPAEEVHAALHSLEERVFRELVLDGKRLDGREHGQLRQLTCEVGVLPRLVHGSAIFTRGETQALVTATLGTVGDEQRVEGLLEEYSKKFMLDYNFPSFSVGETRPFRSPGRREIGHGMLAERSLKAVIPSSAKFPYTIRLVAEILESNGSSSMASVCGGTLALMDAGVPIKDPVAGISIGLVKEPDRFVLLTDIQGDEDHFGDMDFKIAGTQRGITGIQLDLKIDGINEEIIRATLDQAREARRQILRTMLNSLRQPRAEISEFAPRLIQIKINPDKIGLLIGPGGKTIKGIQEATGAKLDVDDDGTVSIAHSSAAGAQAAKMRVEALTEEVRVGKVYEGTVTSIKEFGAFVEILPGRDGLVHISELDNKYVGKVDEVCKVGDKMTVKVIAIDDQDRVKLSRRVLLGPPPEGEEPPPAGPGPRSGGGGRRGGEGRR
jgi:polyribonucleotide nucleotidyltransferase